MSLAASHSEAIPTMIVETTLTFLKTICMLLALKASKRMAKSSNIGMCCRFLLHSPSDYPLTHRQMRDRDSAGIPGPFKKQVGGWTCGSFHTTPKARYSAALNRRINMKVIVRPNGETTTKQSLGEKTSSRHAK